MEAAQWGAPRPTARASACPCSGNRLRRPDERRCSPPKRCTGRPAQRSSRRGGSLQPRPDAGLTGRSPTPPAHQPQRPPMRISSASRFLTALQGLARRLWRGRAQRSVTETFVSTTDVVRCTPTKLQIIKIADSQKPWLTLELAFEVAQRETGLKQLGRLVLTKDGSTVELGTFEAEQLVDAQLEFDKVRDQLLSEVLPDGLQRARTASAAPTPSRRGLVSRVGPWLGGAVVMLLLAGMFGGPAQQPQSPQAQRLAQDVTGIGPTGALVDPAAPAAWNDLPDNYKRVLLAAAERAARGEGTGLPARDVAAVAAAGTDSTPVALANAASAPTGSRLTEASLRRVQIGRAHV